MGADPSGMTLHTVGPDELSMCGIGCVTNPRHAGFGPKTDWLLRRFDEGLSYFLFRDEKGKPAAFLEYVPGEYAWRPVDAAGWLFVHCLWVYPRKAKVPGLGMQLIAACLEAARQADAIGVAAMVSDGPWMVDARIFERAGFTTVARADRFELVANRLRHGDPPRFRDIGANRKQYDGLHVVYAPQCPYLPKSVADMRAVAAEHGLDLEVTTLDTAEAAQHAPSYYGVFSLLWNGELLADHYVSATRFRNILKKQVLER